MTANPAGLQQLLLRNLPAVDQRGEVVEEIGDDFVRLRLPLRDEYVGPVAAGIDGRGIVSGSVTMGFADTALYACVHAFYGEHVLAVIATFNVAFLRVAAAADLVAVARLLRRGRSLAFVEAHLFSGAATAPCAHVTATYAIRELPPA